MKNHITVIEQIMLKGMKSTEENCKRMKEESELSEKRRKIQFKKLLASFQEALLKTSKPVQEEFAVSLEELHNLYEQMKVENRKERQAWFQVLNNFQEESKSYLLAARECLKIAEKTQKESGAVWLLMEQEIEKRDVQFESFEKTLEDCVNHQKEWEETALETQASLENLTNVFSNLMKSLKAR